MTEEKEKEINELKEIKGETLDDDDFVYTQVTASDGSTEIFGGGYKVNSFFMKAGMPIMSTTANNQLETDNQSGGKKVSSPFENLAVPAGLFYVNQPTSRGDTNKSEHYIEHKMLPDDIFDKLFAIMDANRKMPKKTRRNLKETIVKTNKNGRKTRHNKKQV